MSVPGEIVLLERPAAHVALVTINRPDARNAIDGGVVTALRAIIAQTEADPDIRVVLLTGAGDKAFCAGADLKAVARGEADGILSRDAGGFAGFVDSVRTRPWIAVVQGAALAGGCEIALACDMIVATDCATFGLPEVKRSLVAGAGGVYRLPRWLPRNVALELIATGHPIDAQRAFSLGLVNRVVPRAAVLETALALAASIAANAPVAVRESLAVARAVHAQDETALRALSDAALARVMASEDYREGPLAFIEKRAPKWQGR